ncbi:MAG: heavy metal translocating P-type ATPase [Gemmatimonadetes bacterium]|nr:heavy metal translocating P-type ATPase [Gemmatimonadota bacterium]MBK7783855.1 heavy metal translocating P-type ATPase [Gemmatimonadota bacterium]
MTRRSIRIWLAPLGAAAVIGSGLAFTAGPLGVWRDRVWLVGLVVLGLPVIWRTLWGVLHGRFAADLVASLAILVAALMQDPLPGLVVVLMQTGGEALETYAAGRASRAVSALEAEAPRLALRLRGRATEEIPADQVRPGDRLLVRPGDLVPCDAVVIDGYSHVDASRLTGEPMPVAAEPGTLLLSGSQNIEGPLTVEARAVASESQYARIVQLVRSAQASKSPLQRMADRYAVYFTPLTIAVCMATYLVTGEAERVLAVLVVATPCPLLLAAPVALIGGLNRAARRSIIIRHGTALEQLGRVTVALLDKTGTLTIGRPAVAAVLPAPPWTEDEVLAFAAAADLGSGHLLARSVVDAAADRGLTLPVATGIAESPGQGVIGRAGGHEIALGSRSYILSRYPDLGTTWPEAATMGLRATLAIDGRAGGTIEFADRLRPETGRLVAGLTALGLRRIIMVTGDDAGHAAAVARAAGIREVRAGQLPADKLRLVEELERAGERVLMVGDGTNDAPALTRASVGVALASHGGGISAEAADAVVLADDAGRVAEAIAISRRTMRIARQSVWAGLGLSALAMTAAAFGAIPPVAGALLQEAIDVAVILNALRASADRARGTR